MTAFVAVLWLVTLFPAFICQQPLSQIPVPLSGQCQAGCLREFGIRTSTRLMNGEHVEGVDVTNNTQFSLCKLGCQSPYFHELHIPAFKRGQHIYQKILDTKVDITSESKCPSPTVTPVCFRHDLSTSTVSLRLSISIPSPASLTAHFIELLLLRDASASVPTSSILAHHWSYAQLTDIALNMSESALAESQLQASVSTFCESGAAGKVAKSDWIEIGKSIAEQSKIDAKVVKMIWKNDRVAALIHLKFFAGLPPCDYQMSYAKGDDGVPTIFNFTLDKTEVLLIPNLAYSTAYSAQVVSQISHASNDSLTVDFGFQTPKCLDLVDELSFCAPPPVKKADLIWRIDEKSNELNIQWKYDIGSKKRGVETFISFDISLKAVNNERTSKECLAVEKQRKIVTETHRFVAFYVDNLNCEYEIEIVTVDERNRRSEAVKTVVVREQKKMSLFLRGYVTVSQLLFLFAAILIAIGSLSAGYVTLRCRRRGSVYAGTGKRNTKKFKTFLPTDCNKIRVLRMTPSSKAPSTAISSEYSSTGRSSVNTVPYVTRDTMHRCKRKLSSEDSQYETIENYENNLQATTISSMNLLPICAVDNPNMQRALERFNIIPPNHLKCSLSLAGFQSVHFTALHVVDCINPASYLLKYSNGRTEELIREIEVMAYLQNKNGAIMPGIVQLQGLVLADDWIKGLLLEPCRGGSLCSFLQDTAALYNHDLQQPTIRHSSSSSGCTGSDNSIYSKETNHLAIANILISIACDVASALEYLHEHGVCHSHITSESVYMSEGFSSIIYSKTNFSARIGDFGWAELDQDHSDSNSLVDIRICAPEKKHSKQNDIWQLGLLLCELSSLGSFPSNYLYSAHFPLTKNSLQAFSEKVALSQKISEIPSSSCLIDVAKECLQIEIKNRIRIKNAHEKLHKARIEQASSLVPPYHRQSFLV